MSATKSDIRQENRSYVSSAIPDYYLFSTEVEVRVVNVLEPVDLSPHSK